MKKTTLCMGDLGHTTKRMPNNFVPINIGYLGAFAEKKFSGEFSIQLFKDACRLVDVIKEQRPAVLALSNYVWNHNLSMYVAALYKKICPDGFVVVGGPNVPLDRERISEWLTRHRDVDFLVAGEGELSFANIIGNLTDTSFSKDAACRKPIPGVFFLADGKDVVYEEQPLIHDLNILPSPYLNGMMDQFILNDVRGFGLIPMVEGSRGCPFLCTFCRNGREYNSKIRAFDTGRILEEIDYIAAIIRREKRDMSSMLITDQNFGMLSRDVLISEKVSRLKESCGFPMNVMVTTGKSLPDKVIETVSRFDGIAMTMAAQSLDEEVLKNIRRINFPIDKFVEYQKTLKTKKRLSKSDVIMGLPGDTVEKHLNTLRKLLDIGIDVIDTFSFMMLLGTVEESPERRQEFGYKTKWRLLPGAFSSLEGRALLEPEEIVVVTDTFSQADYVYLRRLHLLLATICNGTLFSEIKKVLKERGLDIVEFIQEVDIEIQKIGKGSHVGRAVAEFTSKAISELFDDQKCLTDFYTDKKNYELLCQDELGENLLQKYRFQIFQNLGEFTAVLERVYVQYMQSRERSSADQDKSIFNALRAKNHCLERLLRGEGVDARERFDLDYDVISWKADAGAKLSDYHFSSPQIAHAYFSDKQIESFRCIVGDSSDNSQKARTIYRLGVEFLIPSISMDDQTIGERLLSNSGFEGGSL